MCFSNHTLLEHWTLDEKHYPDILSMCNCDFTNMNDNCLQFVIENQFCYQIK